MGSVSTAPVILILTSRDDATADFVTTGLKQKYIRLDSDDLPAGANVQCTERSAFLTIGGKRWAPTDFSGVWYRRPKAITFRAGADRAECKHAAAEYTAALEGFLALIPEKRWINLPSKNVLAGHKPEQVRRAHDFGFNLPRTLITQDPSQVRKFWKECHRSVVIKPLSSGYIERKPPAADSLIYTSQLREEDLDCDTEIAKCPSLFQERVAKTADIRISVVDDCIEAVELTAIDNGIQRLDIRRNNMVDVKYRRISLPAKVTRNIHRLVSSYGLRFAAIDMLIDRHSRYVFLEINPNGQWAWLDMAGATNIRKLLIRALTIST